MNELLKLKIERILISADDSVLVFIGADKQIAYETYGDCCSETWFADIIGVDALLGATVSEVE